MKRIKSLKQAVDMSIDGAILGEIDADFKIDVQSETWSCYTVSICYRDIFAYCDKGTATLLVDSYGDKHVAELFNWEKE